MTSFSGPEWPIALLTLTGVVLLGVIAFWSWRQARKARGRDSSGSRIVWSGWKSKAARRGQDAQGGRI